MTGDSESSCLGNSLFFYQSISHQTNKPCIHRPHNEKCICREVTVENYLMPKVARFLKEDKGISCSWISITVWHWYELRNEIHVFWYFDDPVNGFLLDRRMLWVVTVDSVQAQFWFGPRPSFCCTVKSQSCDRQIMTDRTVIESIRLILTQSRWCMGIGVAEHHPNHAEDSNAPQTGQDIVRSLLANQTLDISRNAEGEQHFAGET